jgi:hypothetical protein
VPGEEIHEGRSRVMRRFRFLILLSLIALSVTGVLARPAAATEPTREPFGPSSDTFVVDDLCSFPVTVTATSSGTVTSFLDQNGALTRLYFHIVEQDTLTANGKSLTGLPYTFNLEVLFEDGEVTHIFGTGVGERIPLPDGSLFLLAGRVDLVAHPGSMFIVIPDAGRSGDVAALCAALAP